MSRLPTVFAVALIVAGCSGSPAGTPAVAPVGSGKTPTVKHVVILELENRSFDSYFGTFPGANGIPPNPNCNPDPQSGQCLLPYHATSLTNYGGPHSPSDMWTDLDGAKLDGFIVSAEHQPHYIDPNPDDVMGYHTDAELPYYWQLAKEYTLADNNFAATSSWSVMAHLFLVSGWSAKCSIPGDPMSCVTSNDVGPAGSDYAWTDVTWLLHSHGISWGYYVYGQGFNVGPRDDQRDGEGPGPSGFSGPTAWNPLPGFDDVRLDGELQNVQVGSNFLAQAQSGTLPAVSWVMPDFLSSDHPAAPVSGGQAWVKTQIDAVTNGPDGPSTLILVTWDEWGGFYDHVIPPVIDASGYGFRTPLIIVGPMVKRGYIDHQVLTSDAYLKFIEDLFLGSARLDANDGRADSRPDVRENVAGLGDLRNDLTP